MAVTIPVSGDERFKSAVKELSYKHRCSMAQLVYDAIVARHGEELAELLGDAFYFTTNGAEMHRPVRKKAQQS